MVRSHDGSDSLDGLISAAPEPEPWPRPLWRNRDYRLIWAGNLVSSLGSATVLIAFPLLVLAITGKPVQAGGVAAVEAAPYIALSLPLGVLADRFSRRTLLILAGLTSMLASAVIPVAYYLHHLTISLVYLVAVVVGAAGALDQIAQVAILPAVVSKDRLAAASGQSELIFSLTAVAGPRWPDSCCQAAISVRRSSSTRCRSAW